MRLQFSLPFKLLAEGNGGFLDREYSIIANALKENENKNDRECSPSLQMLGRDGT
jgi:hypothetical protein